MSSCRLNVRIPLTVEPAGQDISPASHAPLPWRCGEPKADAGAKGSHVAADAARKKTLSKHAAPASEQRSAVCKAQSLSSSLIHTILAPHQRLLCVEHTLIHRITAPHQRLQCVETFSNSHDNSPSSAAAVCRAHSHSHDNSPTSEAAVCRAHSHSHDNSPTSAAAVCRGLRSLTHSRR